MVRVRIGDGWASDPEVRAALRVSRGAARAAAIRSIVDVLAVEVDGVDIAAGRTEGPLAEGVLTLLGAVDRLAAGAGHATVPFEEGAVELVLHRRGGSVLVSVVTLARPSRVLAHDVDVDLSHLSDALREAARGFCERVASVAPLACASPELRRLLRIASRRASLAEPAGAGTPTTRSRRPRRRPREPSCSFEIHDGAGRLSSWKGPGADLASLLVPGRVSLRSSSGEEILSVEGAPFLSFRDLCASAERLARAHGGPVLFEVARPGRRAVATIRVERGTVSVDGTRPVPCDPMALAQAILDGARDFCAVVKARAPAQVRNSLLADLEETACSTLALVREARAGDRPAGRRPPLRLSPPAHAPAHPLAAGRLRKVSFRRIASHEVGDPASDGLFRSGSALLACGMLRAVALDPATGAEIWRGPGARLATLAEGSLVTWLDNRLSARDAGTGAVLWERAVPLRGSARAFLGGAAPGSILVASGASVTSFDAATGRVAWTFQSPGALRVHPLSLGSLAILAADSGMVHALDPEGRVAWRLRGAGPLASLPIRDDRACLLSFRTPTGATLASVDASTGLRGFESCLDFVPAGTPVSFGGRLAVVGSVGGDVVVAALEGDGSPAWTEPSPTGGSVVLAALGTGLVAKGADGSCAAVDRDGRSRWSRSCDGRPAPPGNLPPVPIRGVVVVAAEEVDLLDGATGTPVGRLPVHTPARLLVDADLTAWALDAEGLLTGARLRGHLSVL